MDILDLSMDILDLGWTGLDGFRASLEGIMSLNTHEVSQVD